jgi:hypothetical protein
LYTTYLRFNLTIKGHRTGYYEFYEAECVKSITIINHLSVHKEITLERKTDNEGNYYKAHLQQWNYCKLNFDSTNLAI